MKSLTRQKDILSLFSSFVFLAAIGIAPSYANEPSEQTQLNSNLLNPAFQPQILEEENASFLQDSGEMPDSNPFAIESETAPTITVETEALPAVAQENGTIPNRISVKKIEIVGSTVFGEAEFLPIVRPIEGKTVTLEELRQVADKITGLYLQENYITSRAVIDEQSLTTDTIQIRIIEGGIEEIRIEGAQRLEDYVRSRVELGTGTPLNTAKLEDQLRLLRVDPLFDSIEASIRAGKGVGQSILVVRVSEADPFVGSIGIDNYSPPSVGAERLSLSLLYRNMTGLGDSLGLSYRPRLETFKTYQLEFAYQVPLNPMNGKLSVRALFDRNEVVNGLFEVLDIQGETDRYEISYRQPLILNPREEFALSVGFAYQNNQLFTFQGPTRFGFGPSEEGITRTSVFSFGQEYTLREASGAWGFRSQFRLGTGLFGATDNEGDIPDGNFFSWLGQIQRVQVLTEDNFLIMQLDLQLTPNSLLPSEQFVIGGAQSVRGYRQNILAGDNGVRFSIEDRIILVRNDLEDPVFTLAPFFDMGVIWNSPDNPNQIFSDSDFIAGLGLGVIWQPVEGLNLRLDYAPPLVDLNIRGDNVQDDGFYFNASYTF